MTIERIEFEGTYRGYIGEAEIVLRGRGAKRQRFRAESRAAMVAQILDWLAKTEGSAMPEPVVATEAPVPVKRGPGRPRKQENAHGEQAV